MFGGPVDTPVAQRLADGGLRYSRFHTTALCSPTRQALLTGRNHHSVGMGAITELATSAPGYNTMRPNTKATLAETLRLNGYSTAQIGKCHEVPVWETSPAGPFDRWPTGSGFEYFYGFVGGETNQYYPTLYEGTTPVQPARTPEQGYHLTEDLAGHGVDWIRRQHALQPDRPLFLYFAPGATHAPHHAPKEWCDRYAGRFDAGWDALREQIFERQKQLGVVPADAELTKFNPEIPHWDEMDDDLKPVLARQMEVYAGFLAHTDAQIGRLAQALDDLGLLDDTLIYYIIGDNGASAEGTMHGSFNEAINYNGLSALETTGLPARQGERARHPHRLQPLRGGLGPRSVHAVPVDQAGRLALGRHPQRHHRALARPHHRQGRAPRPVRPCHRRRADHPGGGWPARARHRARGHPGARSRACPWATPSARPRHRNGTRPSTSRSQATAASTTAAGPRSPSTAPLGSCWARSSRPSTTTSGSCTAQTTGHSPATWLPSSPTCCTGSSGSG